MFGSCGVLGEQYTLITATSLTALTGAAGDAEYLSLATYHRVTVILQVLNATTVTGGTITLKQATSIAGAGEKALVFTRMLVNLDIGASQTMVDTAVTSSTFITDATNSKRLCYVIEIDADTLDSGFNCFRVDSAGMANAIGVVSYLAWTWARYRG
jgi:hypothetical protein